MLNMIDVDFDFQDIPLLKKVNFHLPEGGLVHLRGANGSGKTTLIKLMAGLYPPSKGEIQFYGQSIANNLAAYQGNLCLVGHKTGLNPYLTVREACFFDVRYKSHEKDIAELVSVFKLEHHLDAFCGLLSAGQKRQVGLLRLWMSNAKLWLLDEPLVALDDSALAILMKQIARHREQGGGVVLTSHQTLPLHGEDYQEYRL